MVKPDKEERRVAMCKDNKLRLLMTLVGFQRLSIDDDMDASWIIPSSTTSSILSENLEMIQKAQVDPPTFEDGKTAEDFIRRKLTARTRRADYDDSEDDGFIDYNDDLQFPAGGPTVRKSDALEDLKKKRSRRKKEDGEEEIDDEELKALAQARREARIKMQQKIKSDLFVHQSDEEENEERDREFFTKEEERRKAQSRKVLEALRQGRAQRSKDEIEESIDREVLGHQKNKKRKKGNEEEGGQKRRKKKTYELSGSDEDQASLSSRASSPGAVVMSESENMTDTPISSPHHHSSQESRAKRAESTSSMTDHSNAISKTQAGEDHRDEDGGEEPLVSSSSKRIYGGFVVDSDSD